MKRNEILEKLKEILLSANESFAGIIDTVNDDTDLQKDLGLASVNMLYLIIATEEEFNIRFSDVGVNEFHTVGSVIDYIEKKIS